MNWINSYKKLADVYIEEFESRWEEGVDTATALSHYVRTNFQDITRVLDVPCGIGRLSIPLSLLGFSVLGIDFSDKFIEYANKKKSEYGSGTLKFVVGDMFSSDEVILSHKPQLVIIWWTSIGYNGRKTDLKFLKHLKMVTEHGTILIVETWTREYVINFPIRRFWNDLGKSLVIVSQQVDPLTEFVKSEHSYFRKINDDLKYVGSFASKIMLYSVVELRSMFESAGWKVLRVANSISQIDGSFNPRIDRCVFVCESF